MRPRITLWLKKRGDRRTGSPRWAASGEVLYHAVFIGVGVVAAWLHTTSVVIPEWQRRDRMAGYEQGECVIVDSRLGARKGVAGPEYLPECLVQLRRDEQLSPPVAAPVGEYTTSLRRAERQRDRWTPGDVVECWFDPENPRTIVLTRRWHGWPAMVLIIPGSLIVLGLVGVVRALLRGGASSERRQVVTQHALASYQADEAPGSPPPSSGLPTAETIADSPGVRLRFRLPIEGHQVWRVAGMAFICIAWNGLVGFFLYGVIVDHLTGEPDWTVTLIVTPLAIAGGWLAYQMLRDARGVSGVGATRVEVSDHPLRPGGEYRGAVLQTGQFTARTLTVSLLCEEIATYWQGTDTRRSVEGVHREVLLRRISTQVEPGEPLEADFSFRIPTRAMHSFLSPHNEVRWSIEVAGVPKRWEPFRRRFRFCVYPPAWPDVPAPPTMADATPANQAGALA